ncbi:energy-coupling factor transporter transmembrane component T family protein [[Acholeplasma] multilocale]|uniref:energy-coupling factor transporter transmembrane component T family protein n=1 Tax=[Acholeplasma] multilocale TaxID=264638 RepID=UPI00047D8E5B|nr:energy-coupling factor transporter transmembrane component T [[Acholeplasma] multilocale]
MRITFGRYIPKNSVIHKMDPRLKLLMIILLIVGIFFPIGFTGYIVMSVVIFGIFAMSRLPWRMLLKLIAPVLFIFIVIFAINLFLMHPDKETFKLLTENGGIDQSGILIQKVGGGWSGFISPNLDSSTIAIPDLGLIKPIGHFYKTWNIWLSEKALYSALLMGWRIYLMITLTCILTGSTQPLELTLAIEDLLYPLKLIGIPVYILSMIISIALRMIPTLIDEAGRIMKAQSSRGIDIKNGKAKDKVKGLTSLIIPLLVSAFQKAEDLAYAMDARGYEPHAKRTRYVQFKFRISDLVIFLFGMGMAIFAIVYGAMGYDALSFMHIPYIDQLTLY